MHSFQKRSRIVKIITTLNFTESFNIMETYAEATMLRKYLLKLLNLKYSDLKNPFSKEWFRCNDEKVSVIRDSEGKSIMPDNFASESAYLLFYQRNDE